MPLIRLEIAPLVLQVTVLQLLLHLVHNLLHPTVHTLGLFQLELLQFLLLPLAVEVEGTQLISVVVGISTPLAEEEELLHTKIIGL
jgi:hypothetical protein